MASWAAIAKTEPVKAVQVPVVHETKPRTAVIDANAIISGGLLNLMRSCDRAVTVPEVLREVRDKQSRSWLAALPFKIETQEPAEDSLKAVVKFARATGDLHALSAVDTRLLALARTLEASYYGDAHLREVPDAPKVRAKGAVDSKSLPGWGAEGGDWAEMDRLNEEELEAAEAALLQGGAASRIAAQIQELTLEDDASTVGSGGPDGAPAERINGAELAIDADDADASDGSVSGDEDGEGGGDDDGGEEWEVAKKSRNKARRAKRRHLRWAEHQAAERAVGADGEEMSLDSQQQMGQRMSRPGEGGCDEELDDADQVEGEEWSEEEEGGEEGGTAVGLLDHTPLGFESAVCSVTADFAMQNVLLQMGLRLAAPDGRRVSSVSRWVLRCTACRCVTKEVGRLFCPRCGNAALERVRVVVGPDGAEQFGVRKKHVLRGTRFSLPKPRGGRAADVILAEDQLLAKAHLLRAKKKAAESEKLDPFAPEYSADTWHQAAALPTGSKSAAALLAGWKRNPNERKHVATNRRRK